MKSRLGMEFETFRSSVLLRQGEADQLLVARSSDRFRVLAGLIDLSAYQRLEQQAGQRRRTAAAEANQLEQQLASLRPVTDEDLAAAEAKVQQADTSVTDVDTRRAQAESRQHGAGRHQQLQSRRNGLLQRHTELRATVEDADSIRQRATEHARLQQFLPHAQAAVDDLAAAKTASAQATRATEAMAAIDLAALHEDADQAQRAQRELQEQLDALNDQASKLTEVAATATRLYDSRQAHTQRTQALARLGGPAKLKAEARRLEAELAAAASKRHLLQQRRQAASTRHGAARQRLTQATRCLRDLDGLAGQPTCSRCLQPISPEHLQEERTAAAAEHEAATAALTAAQTIIKQFGDAIAAETTLVEDLDRRHLQAAKTAEAAVTAARELDRAAKELAAVQAACDTLTIPEPAAAQFAMVRTGDLGQAARAVRALTTGKADAQGQIRREKSRRDRAQTAADAAARAVQESTAARARHERDATQAAATAQHRIKQAEVRLEGVPAEVASAIRAGDTTILNDLTARLAELTDATDALEQLTKAETDLAETVAKVRVVEEELAAVPEEHRIPLADAQTALQLAQRELSTAHTARDDARDHHQRLTGIHQRRQELTSQLGETCRRERAANRLAGLLGRGELQGRLLTEATTGVGAYANDALARISGGTLEVALHRKGDDNSTLEILVYDRSSAQAPLEVGFISGSQRFRVAVALAAGLGQYLGGSAAIRALIIDEGFGSLDADGRQRMIQELRTLAEHLDRIIVVSHHEDFADRTLFPNAYLLRKHAARTVVDRVG